MPRPVEYSDAVRDEVLLLRNTGMSLRRIAASVGVTLSKVQRICDKVKG